MDPLSSWTKWVGLKSVLAFLPPVLTQSGRAEGEKSGLGRCSNTVGGVLLRRSATWVVMTCVPALAPRPHFVSFPFPIFTFEKSY